MGTYDPYNRVWIPADDMTNEYMTSMGSDNEADDDDDDNVGKNSNNNNIKQEDGNESNKKKWELEWRFVYTFLGKWAQCAM